LYYYYCYYYYDYHHHQSYYNRSQIVVGVYLWLAAISSVLPYHSHLLYNCTWIVRTTIAPSAMIVTLVYWSLLFPIWGTTSVIDVHVHLVNSLIILIDFVLSRLPFYLCHFYQPDLYMITYMIFTIIYWAVGATTASGDHFIYSPLNYQDHPGAAAAMILILVFVVFPILMVGLWRWWWFCERRFGGSTGGGTSTRSTSESIDDQQELTTVSASSSNFAKVADGGKACDNV